MKKFVNIKKLQESELTHVVGGQNQAEPAPENPQVMLYGINRICKKCGAVIQFGKPHVCISLPLYGIEPLYGIKPLYGIAIEPPLVD